MKLMKWSYKFKRKKTKKALHTIHCIDLCARAKPHFMAEVRLCSAAAMHTIIMRLTLKPLLGAVLL